MSSIPNVGSQPNLLRPPARHRWWSRRTWLRAAVVNAFIAGFTMMCRSALGPDVDSALLRQAAQVALMHAMGTIACATFMKMDAAAAARARSSAR